MMINYDEWLRQVDAVIMYLVGLTHDDLADQPWRDWHESGMLPREAAREALKSEGFPLDGEEQG